MNIQSFASGYSATLSTSQQTAQRNSPTPHDPTLRFNRNTDPREEDPSKMIYSIDASAFLKAIDDDQLNDIYKITLAARPTRTGVGIWDTMFNNPNRQTMSACILMAQGDYTPIPSNRVVVTSSFLDFSMATTRVHLNEVLPGDRIGIGINDMLQGLIYVLLYEVEDICTITSAPKENGERGSRIPAVNIRMDHAIRLDYEDNTTIIDMHENATYDPEKARPFVEWIADSVHDIAESYPWKPHLLPWVPNKFKRPELEERLSKALEDHTEISFAEFETRCRKVYRTEKFRQQQTSGNLRKRPSVKSRERDPINLPVVEIMSQGDFFFANFGDTTADGKITNTAYRFRQDELGKHGITELFLTNKDLDGVNLAECSKVMVLTEETFGANALLRYFTLNF